MLGFGEVAAMISSLVRPSADDHKAKESVCDLRAPSKVNMGHLCVVLSISIAMGLRGAGKEIQHIYMLGFFTLEEMHNIGGHCSIQFNDNLGLYSDKESMVAVIGRAQ